MNPSQPHSNQHQGGEKQGGEQHAGQQHAGHPQGGRGVDLGTNRMLPGIILIGIGLIALFNSLDLESWLSRLVLAVILGAGAYFAYRSGERNDQPHLRWAAAPLAVLAVAVLISGGVGGALMVGVFALAFYLVWQRDARRWWALIPAGVLATIAVMQLLEAIFGSAPEWFFLVGLAVTFYALTRLTVHSQRWAIYPAVALIVAAALTLISASGWLGPVILIAIGVFLLFRSGALAGLTGVVAPRVRAEPQGKPAEPVPPADPVYPSEAGQTASPVEPSSTISGAPMPGTGGTDD